MTRSRSGAPATIIGAALTLTVIAACARGAEPVTRSVARGSRLDPRTSAPDGRAGVDAADPALDDELVGTMPPAWTTTNWVNLAPDQAGLTLEQLRGRVVLVRWFMGPSCPFCSATAPALRRLHADFVARGLVVVGLYHHKETTPLRAGEVAGYVRGYGFEFPVATDPEWTTLKSWWLNRSDRAFTSVSFLLDRRGRVRGVHPGGRYAIGDASYAAVRRAVERLLAEPADVTRGT